VVAGANGAGWEVIERGGSYMIPIAALCVLLHLKGQNAEAGVFFKVSLTNQGCNEPATIAT
jgi:hypothetical protein